MTEKIVKGEEFQRGIQNGINKLADAVKDTLGPLGNTVVIKNEFGEIVISKDGVSVAEAITLPDPIESIGAELVKEVSMRANNLAGDGTTTATVLSQAIYNAGIKSLALGNKPLEFKKGMKQASLDTLEFLVGQRKVVTVKSKELRDIAMVSSNGDEYISKTITDIYAQLGVNAVISTIQGDGMETTKNIVQGMQFDRGYLSPYCVTDRIKMKAEIENPYIFLYDGKISEMKDIVPVLEFVGQKNRPVIIVSEGVQDAALRVLSLNHISGNVRSAIVTSPGYGNKRVERLQDMAVLFGGEVFDKDFDMSEFDGSMLGEMDKAEITNKDTAFIGGKGEQDEVNKRAAHIVSQLEHYKGNTYETNILEERLGKLTGGVAVIKVGAMSKEEGKELLDRVEDCKFAVRAALKEGIVNGGGMALYEASKGVVRKNEGSQSYIAGYETLLECIKSPFKQILINAGETPEVIENMLSIKVKSKGYDVKNGVYVDSMMAAGISDPFKVVRIALESAVSIVGTLLTSNYAVINKDDTTTTQFT